MKYKINLPSVWENLKQIGVIIIQFDAETTMRVTNHILDTIERLKHFKFRVYVAGRLAKRAGVPYGNL